MVKSFAICVIPFLRRARTKLGLHPGKCSSFFRKITISISPSFKKVADAVLKLDANYSRKRIEFKSSKSNNMFFYNP